MKPLGGSLEVDGGRLQAPAGTPSWSAWDPMKAGLGGSQNTHLINISSVLSHCVGLAPQLNTCWQLGSRMSPWDLFSS